MANVKILIWKHKKTNEKFPICLRITQDRKPVYFFTKYFCFEKDWNEEKSRLYKSHRDFYEINLYLDNLLSKVNRIILDFETNGKQYTASTIKNILIGKISSIDLFQFIDSLISEYTTTGKYGNAKVYVSLKKFLIKYSGKNSFAFSDINYDLLKKIELLYFSRGHKANGLALHFRTLKAIYNKAILAGYININPIQKYKVKTTKTTKRAISKTDIEKIRDVDLPEYSPIWHSRNYFMFSFYLMGLNFIDLAYLKKSNLSGLSEIKTGTVILNYMRKKTSKPYKMNIPAPALAILDKYNINNKSDEDYIFPILTTKDPAISFKQILNKRAGNQHNLKKLGVICELEKKLTGYVARHSWASIALKMNIPIGIISQGLGHEDIKTTQIYLECFDDDAMNKANLLIIG